MAVYQFQKRTDGHFVEMINPFGAVYFHFHKTAGLKAFYVMRYQTLLQFQFLGNIGNSVRIFFEQMNNIPPRVIAEGFKKELMRLV